MRKARLTSLPCRNTSSANEHVCQPLWTHKDLEGLIEQPFKIEKHLCIEHFSRRSGSTKPLQHSLDRVVYSLLRVTGSL